MPSENAVCCCEWREYERHHVENSGRCDVDGAGSEEDCKGGNCVCEGEGGEGEGDDSAEDPDADARVCKEVHDCVLCITCLMWLLDCV